MKKILITGADSYVGTQVEKWLLKYTDDYYVKTIDVKDETWNEYDFSMYDAVLHVAGIAHVSSKTKMKDFYYNINTILAIETAKKAKADGVKQFIFMSSIIIYGECAANKGVIKFNTKPEPNSFYGKSKLKAEKGIKQLETDVFKVAIVRAPMVYGKYSRGNYQKLSKLAQKLPIFPDFHNERSMVHIDNLCELIKILIDNEERGIFFPQNKDYVCTSEMVRTIALIYGKNIIMTKGFNPIIKLLHGVGIVKKVFGNMVYDQSMSIYKKKEYQVRDFKRSIELTEKSD